MFKISSIYERIRKLRENKGITQDELANKLGYTSRSSIAKIESGKTDISQSKLKEIALILNTTTSYLLDGENNINAYKQLDKLPKDKEKLLNIYDKLNEEGKEKAIERVEELTQIPKYTLNNVEEELSITTENNIVDLKDIKIYDTPVSAGKGSFMNDYEPYNIIKVDVRLTPQARRCDFALKVRGDSMEPYYYDGDIVFVKEQPSLDNGQIGIFIYEDEAYIKKYSLQEDGVYLISLNKNYPPIKIDENNAFKICGLVLTV